MKRLTPYQRFRSVEPIHEKMRLRCPSCAAKFTLQSSKMQVMVTCAKCSNAFFVDVPPLARSTWSLSTDPCVVYED